MIQLLLDNIPPVMLNFLIVSHSYIMNYNFIKNFYLLVLVNLLNF